MSLVLFLGLASLLTSVSAGCVLNEKFCNATDGTPTNGYVYVRDGITPEGTAQCTFTSGTLSGLDCAPGFVRNPEPPASYRRNILCVNNAWTGLTPVTPTPAEVDFLTCVLGPRCVFSCGPNAAGCRDGTSTGTVPLGSTAGCAEGFFPTSIPKCEDPTTELNYVCTQSPSLIQTSAAWLNYLTSVAVSTPRAVSFAFTPDVCNSACTPTSPPTSACGGRPYACSPCLNCTLTDQTFVDFGTVVVRSSGGGSSRGRRALVGADAGEEGRGGASAGAGGDGGPSESIDGEWVESGMSEAEFYAAQAREEAQQRLVRTISWRTAARHGGVAAIRARQQRQQHRQEAQQLNLAGLSTAQTRVVHVACTGSLETQMACLEQAACDGFVVESTYCVISGAITACPGWSVARGSGA